MTKLLTMPARVTDATRRCARAALVILLLVPLAASGADVTLRPLVGDDIEGKLQGLSADTVVLATEPTAAGAAATSKRIGGSGGGRGGGGWSSGIGRRRVV